MHGISPWLSSWRSAARCRSSGKTRKNACSCGARTKQSGGLLGNELTDYRASHMVPQAASNNRGPWEKLEAERRALAGAGKEALDALRRRRVNEVAEQRWGKVPQATFIFWIIKIAATTLGETGGDT